MHSGLLSTLIAAMFICIGIPCHFGNSIGYSARLMLDEQKYLHRLTHNAFGFAVATIFVGYINQVTAQVVKESIDCRGMSYLLAYLSGAFFFHSYVMSYSPQTYSVGGVYSSILADLIESGFKVGFIGAKLLKKHELLYTLQKKYMANNCINVNGKIDLYLQEYPLIHAKGEGNACISKAIEDLYFSNACIQGCDGKKTAFYKHFLINDAIYNSGLAWKDLYEKDEMGKKIKKGISTRIPLDVLQYIVTYLHNPMSQWNLPPNSM